MDPERWQEIDRLFALALELPEDERGPLLERECGGDVQLRREVESLIENELDDGFLDSGAGALSVRKLLEPPAEDLVGRTIGRFEVEARLGRGGMGDVYRARDPLLDRPVALKLIQAHLRDDPDRRKRFRREALTASSLNHPNLVTVHEIVELEDHDLLVTELVDGESLGERLRRGPLPIDEALGIALQVARGLGAAHAVGVVHRDVKPGNLMIRPDGLVKVLDFGIAKATRPSRVDPSDPNTEDGSVVGTAEYMSPEQATGDGVDARTDLWSLGVALYEMLTGTLPFTGGTRSERLGSIVSAKPEPPGRRRDGIPAAVDRIVARALTRDRDERYRDASSMADDLERARVALSGHTTGDEAARGPIPRSRRALPALALALAATAIAVVWRVASPVFTEQAPRPVVAIAVLPLENVARDPQLDYLGDGLTESLIRSLATDGLTVASRTSVFRYQRRDVSAVRVARELGVDAVLFGRLHASNGHLVVDVELVDGRDESHLWGDRYEVADDDLPSTPDRIAADLGRSLHRRPNPAARDRVTRLRPQNAEAYDLYLKGRYSWYRTASAEYHQSRDFFLRAIALDPGYALAWAGLAHYYGYAAADGRLEPDEAWRLTEEATRRAAEIDPELPEIAPLWAAITLYRSRDWARGERELAASTERFPEALNHHSFVLGLFGDLEGALRVRQLDRQLHPASVRAERSFGVTLYLARRYEEAITQLHRALALSENDVATLEALADALIEADRRDEAIEALRRSALASGRKDLADLLTRTLASDGAEAALRALARARLDELQTRAANGEWISAYDLAREHLRAGEPEAGLAKALEVFAEHNRHPLDMVADPVFDVLRDQPAFDEGVRRLDLPPGALPVGRPSS